MIERQIIDGRPATVTYIWPDFRPATKDAFSLAKVHFDDGDVLFLAAPDPAEPDPSEEGGAEAAGFARHRGRHAVPLTDAASEEMAGWARHREKHRRVAIEPTEPEPSTAHQLRVWAKAVAILDASERLVRDVIERELADITTGTPAVSSARVNAIVKRALPAIESIRRTAVKTAFRFMRDELGDRKILDHTLAEWASAFLREDMKGIDTAIRAGLISGLDNTEIARKVVGSMGLNGVDGVTEFTRHKIAHLGRAAIKESNARRS